ncbi:F-box/kelch-repeat protein At3g04660-like [Papaver somniferum]|uniref:F-box/kelch-repeat protein At3g04660-like n=1 Tax=Papaver somniferum TaxID=3469 RepID=UPI000E6F685C|nr:F-box/kelch-repeat protein At3g04660-like [Papaver somniferum]
MLEDKERAASTASVSTITKMKFPYESEGFFGPVNGLVGIHSKKYSSICICNVSTQKVSPWIKSTLYAKDLKRIDKGTPYCYEMGFDPATKKHKVICIGHIYDSPDDVFCEVLTVGDKKWRRIESPPFKLELEYHQRKRTVYLNGYIYYSTSTFMKANELGNDKIVAFDAGAEKFRVITVPNFILNQPRHVYQDGTSSNNLIEVDGRLALLSRLSDYIAKLWIFDDVQSNNNAVKNTSSNQDWTEVNFDLPYLWSADLDLHFYCVSGTDQLIIESLENNLVFRRLLYNRRTKSCKKINTSGINYSGSGWFFWDSYYRVSTFVESLLHVQ